MSSDLSRCSWRSAPRVLHSDSGCRGGDGGVPGFANDTVIPWARFGSSTTMSLRRLPTALAPVGSVAPVRITGVTTSNCALGGASMVAVIVAPAVLLSVAVRLSALSLTVVSLEYLLAEGPKKCIAQVTLSAPAAVHSSRTMILEKFWTTEKPLTTRAVAGMGGFGPKPLAYAGVRLTSACGSAEQLKVVIELTAVSSCVHQPGCSSTPLNVRVLCPRELLR